MHKLYRVILIPSAVYEELLDERAGEIVTTAVKSAEWLDRYSVQNQELVNQLRNSLNAGEAEAIALAFDLRATRLLIDERLGRQAAIGLGLKITGILGILLLAKRENLVTAVKPIMEDLMSQSNFRISSQLYAEVLALAGE
jgi:predicted nucleic acid-binding protein